MGNILLKVSFFLIKTLRKGLFFGEQGCRRCESTIVARVNIRALCHMWVEFVGRSRFVPRVFLQYSDFPPSKTNISKTNISKFRFDQDRGPA